MDNPLYDRELDAYPPIPGSHVRPGPINRESPDAAQPKMVRGPKAPSRKPPKNPPRAPGPAASTSPAGQGRASLLGWLTGLNSPGLIGVGLAAGILISAPFALVFLVHSTVDPRPEDVPRVESPVVTPVPAVAPAFASAPAVASPVFEFVRTWPLYTASVVLACGLTIWGRRWLVQADLVPGGDYGLSPRELKVLAGESLIGVVVASWLAEGVVYRPPGTFALLIRDGLPDDADDLERTLLATLPWANGTPLEVYRLEEPFLRAIQRRLRYQGLLVSESRDTTLRTILLSVWGAPTLIALFDFMMASQPGSAWARSGGTAFVLFVINLIGFGIAFGRVPPLPQLTRRGRHALDTAQKAPTLVGPSDPATVKGRMESRFVPAPKPEPPDDFGASWWPTDPPSMKEKGAMGPIAPDDSLEGDRLDDPLKADEEDFAIRAHPSSVDPFPPASSTTLTKSRTSAIGSGSCSRSRDPGTSTSP